VTTDTETLFEKLEPGQPAEMEPKHIRLTDLRPLHRKLKLTKVVADYLGYTERGYLKIRERLKRGEILHHRLEDLIRYKLSQLELETINNKESQS